MKTPFEILDISEDSEDEIVKKAYLRMVKRYPPERCPEEFQRIRTAYERIRTRKDRLRFALFDISLPDREELIVDIRAGRKGKRPNIDMVQALLKTSVMRQMDGVSDTA